MKKEVKSIPDEKIKLSLGLLAHNILNHSSEGFINWYEVREIVSYCTKDREEKIMLVTTPTFIKNKLETILNFIIKEKWYFLLSLFIDFSTEDQIKAVTKLCQSGPDKGKSALSIAAENCDIAALKGLLNQQYYEYDSDTQEFKKFTYKKILNNRQIKEILLLPHGNSLMEMATMQKNDSMLSAIREALFLKPSQWNKLFKEWVPQCHEVGTSELIWVKTAKELMREIKFPLIPELQSLILEYAYKFTPAITNSRSKKRSKRKNPISVIEMPTIFSTLAETSKFRLEISNSVPKSTMR